jgi:large subunit ribosomal protein L35
MSSLLQYLQLTPGTGDMNKPIYRYLANQKWREYKRKITIQRITQMHVIPDVLPSIDPTVSVDLRFPGLRVQPGQFVDSRRSQFAPSLTIQAFDQGPRFVTIAVIDSDVPDQESDSFDYRCHGLYANIEITPTNGRVMLNQKENEASIILPWIPPYAQKGSPYHRLSVFVLQQPEGQKLDVAAIQEKTERDGFKLRSFVTRHALKPVGVTMFRSQWDEGTEMIMNRYNIPGADIVWKQKPSEKLPYKKKDGKRYR